MTRLAALLLAVTLSLLAGWSLVSAGYAEKSDEGLSGGRPEIDAGEFSSLQAALDALPAEGGLVRLPAGQFAIDQPLRIGVGDVTLIGAGTATHIKNVNASGQPALLLAAGEPGKEKDLWRIHLANFRITGNEKSGPGIVARKVNEVLIENVTVSYHGGDGIVLDRCYEDPRVIGSLITYNQQTGLNLLGCHDIVVASNQFEENRDALRCSDGFNLCMTGNNLDDHLAAGVIIENTYGSVLSGNMIEECQGPAVVLDRDCYGITVSANVIAHDGAGVLLKDAHGCAVSANTFTIMVGDALWIGPHSSRITVSANNFSNSHIGDDKVKRGAKQLMAGGLVLEGTTDIAISGNLFAGLNPKPGVELRGEKSRRVAFTGNVMTEVESQHEQLEDSVIADNVLPAK